MVVGMLCLAHSYGEQHVLLQRRQIHFQSHQRGLTQNETAIEHQEDGPPSHRARSICS